MLKVKFTRNTAVLDMMNSSSKILILNPEGALGILDLRLLDSYKIKQGVSQQILSRFYKLDLAEKICDRFNNSINTLKKEKA